MVSRPIIPVSVLDVATYIVEQLGPLSAWKTQKLCYYSQAWSLVWNGEALFVEPIEAWRDGPVVRELYNATKHFDVLPGEIGGDVDKLHQIQIANINRVLGHYGKHNGHVLSELTHSEGPWQEARGGLSEGAYSNNVIPLPSIMNYYRSKADDAKDRLDSIFSQVADSKQVQEAVDRGWQAIDAGDVVAADDIFDSL